MKTLHVREIENLRGKYTNSEFDFLVAMAKEYNGPMNYGKYSSSDNKKPYIDSFYVWFDNNIKQTTK